ncbi:uncharacterized protein LOC135928488 isoform X3 [Gordionus sp. m RMFG-2023]|uniref:uncharacterized protein LOC135928488 isoform X3 n=1 Tax=Gordionus sp. m RMFG-2023 TaxID=3053472 RepID=UPI0031FBF1E0
MPEKPKAHQTENNKKEGSLATKIYRKICRSISHSNANDLSLTNMNLSSKEIDPNLDDLNNDNAIDGHKNSQDRLLEGNERQERLKDKGNKGNSGNGKEKKNEAEIKYSGEQPIYFKNYQHGDGVYLNTENKPIDGTTPPIKVISSPSSSKTAFSHNSGKTSGPRSGKKISKNGESDEKKKRGGSFDNTGEGTLLLVKNSKRKISHHDFNDGSVRDANIKNENDNRKENIKNGDVRKDNGDEELISKVKSEVNNNNSNINQEKIKKSSSAKGDISGNNGAGEDGKIGDSSLPGLLNSSAIARENNLNTKDLDKLPFSERIKYQSPESLDYPVNSTSKDPYRNALTWIKGEKETKENSNNKEQSLVRSPEALDLNQHPNFVETKYLSPDGLDRPLDSGLNDAPGPWLEGKENPHSLVIPVDSDFKNDSRGNSDKWLKGKDKPEDLDRPIDSDFKDGTQKYSEIWFKGNAESSEQTDHILNGLVDDTLTEKDDNSSMMISSDTDKNGETLKNSKVEKSPYLNHSSFPPKVYDKKAAESHNSQKALLLTDSTQLMTAGTIGSMGLITFVKPKSVTVDNRPHLEEIKHSCCDLAKIRWSEITRLQEVVNEFQSEANIATNSDESKKSFLNLSDTEKSSLDIKEDNTTKIINTVEKDEKSQDGRKSPKDDANTKSTDGEVNSTIDDKVSQNSILENTEKINAKVQIANDYSAKRNIEEDNNTINKEDIKEDNTTKIINTEEKDEESQGERESLKNDGHTKTTDGEVKSLDDNVQNLIQENIKKVNAKEQVANENSAKQNTDEDNNTINKEGEVKLLHHRIDFSSGNESKLIAGSLLAGAAVGGMYLLHKPKSNGDIGGSDKYDNEVDTNQIDENIERKTGKKSALPTKGTKEQIQSNNLVNNSNDDNLIKTTNDVDGKGGNDVRTNNISKSNEEVEPLIIPSHIQRKVSTGLAKLDQLSIVEKRNNIVNGDQSNQNGLRKKNSTGSNPSHKFHSQNEKKIDYAINRRKSDIPASPMKKWASSLAVDSANDYNIKRPSFNAKPLRTIPSFLSDKSKKRQITIPNSMKHASSHTLLPSLPIMSTQIGAYKYGRHMPEWNPADRSFKKRIKGRPVIFYAPTKYSFETSSNTNSISSSLIAFKPRADLSIDWVYGYQGKKGRNNVHLLKSQNEWVYHTASMAIILNLGNGERKQRIYSGHREEIKCIAVHPERIIVASGQTAGLKEKTSVQVPSISNRISLKTSKYNHPADATDTFDDEYYYFKPHARIWDSSTLQTLAVIFDKSFEKAITCICFSQTDGGKLLAVIDDSSDHILSIWDWERSTKLIETKTGPDQILSLKFSPFKPGFIVICGKSNLTLWKIIKDDSKSGEKRDHLSTLSNSLSLVRKNATFDKNDKPKFVICLAFLHDGNLLTGDSNGSLMLWSKDDMSLINILPNIHPGGLFSIMVYQCYNGKKIGSDIIATGGKDRIIKTWAPHSFELLTQTTQLDENLGAIRVICPGLNFQNDDKNTIGEKELSKNEVKATNNDISDKKLLSNSVSLNGLDSGNCILIGTTKNCLLHGNFKDGFSVLIQGHVDIITGLTYHPSKDEMLTTDLNGQIKLWDCRRRRCIFYREITESATCACFSPTSENLVAIGTNTGSWIVLNLEDKQIIGQYGNDTDVIYCLSYSPSGDYIAVGSQDTKIYVYIITDKGYKYENYCQFKGHSSRITHLDWSVPYEGSYYLRSNSSDCELLFWDVNTKQQMFIHGAQKSNQYGNNNSEFIRDIRWATQNCVITFEVIGIWGKDLSGNDINCSTKSNNNLNEIGRQKLLGIGDDSCKVRLYAFPTNPIPEINKPMIYSGHTSHVTNITFSRSDDFLISTGGKDTTIIQWKYSQWCVVLLSLSYAKFTCLLFHKKFSIIYKIVKLKIIFFYIYIRIYIFKANYKILPKIIIN